MATSAVRGIDTRNQVLRCPRDGRTMDGTTQGEAVLDVCGKCGGTYFDQGELFAALGGKADPSLWDRAESAGGMKTGELPCPRCVGEKMLVQDVSYEGEKVEIDRCAKCGGVWLDKGEGDKIIAIGTKMAPLVEAERAKAQAELDKMQDPTFEREAGLLWGLSPIFVGIMKLIKPRG